MNSNSLVNKQKKQNKKKKQQQQQQKEYEDWVSKVSSKIQFFVLCNRHQNLLG